MLNDIMICFYKDLKFYFASRMIYLILAVYMLMITSFTCFGSGFYTTTEVNLQSFFLYQPVVLAMVIPGLTMRSFADEYRNRTLEIILSQPISRTAIVMGKFLAVWAVCGIMLLSSMIVWGILAFMLPLDNLWIALSYPVAFLVAGTLCAAALWGASFSYNFAAAFILGISICSILLNFNFGWIAEMISSSSLLGIRVAKSFSFLKQYAEIISGQLRLSSLLYFISISAGFITLTIINLEYKRR